MRLRRGGERWLSKRLSDRGGHPVMAYRLHPAKRQHFGRLPRAGPALPNKPSPTRRLSPKPERLPSMEMVRATRSPAAYHSDGRGSALGLTRRPGPWYGRTWPGSAAPRPPSLSVKRRAPMSRKTTPCCNAIRPRGGRRWFSLTPTQFLTAPPTARLRGHCGALLDAVDAGLPAEAPAGPSCSLRRLRAPDIRCPTPSATAHLMHSMHAYLPGPTTTAATHHTEAKMPAEAPDDQRR